MRLSGFLKRQLEAMERIDHLTLPPLFLYRKETVKTPNASLESYLGKELTISKHAQARLKERSISLPEDKWLKMNSSLKTAMQKGVKEALVLSEEGAFIVNVKKAVIITAMNRKEASSQIFTNINGTIILD